MPLFLRRLVRASALYDLVLTAPFATPWTFALARQQLSELNVALGGQALPPFAPFHILFACLLGSVVLIWALLRLRHPAPRYALYDGGARLLFSLWMGWTLAMTGAPLLWLFLLPEGAWCLAQWYAVSPFSRRSVTCKRNP
jgi:hypothetical protein